LKVTRQSAFAITHDAETHSGHDGASAELRR